MKTGVIFPSYAHEVTTVSHIGAWSAAYPLLNVTDLVRPSKPARASAAGDRSIYGTFPSNRPVQAIAIIGHNVPAANVIGMEILLWSGPDGTGTLLATSGGIDWWTAGSPGVAGYRWIRPYIFSAPFNVRSFQIYISNTGTPLEIQAIDVGGFWEWPGISYGRDLGVSSDEDEIQLVGGASYRPDRATPRQINGQIDLIAMAKTSTTGLDFQKGVDLQRPFVWAEDFDDPTTWARKCLLARNVALPGMVGARYRHDRFPIQMIEHMR